MVVGSTNDLKPASFKWVKRKRVVFLIGLIGLLHEALCKNALTFYNTAII
jgi:hypothetical protein